MRLDWKIWFALTGILLVLCVLPFAFLAMHSSEDALAIRGDQRLLPPGPGRPLGTDALGRDVFSRTLWAGAISLRSVSVVLAVALPLAILLGGVAGFAYGRPPDLAVSWVIDVLHIIPFFLLAAAFSALVAAEWLSVSLIVGAVVWASPARLVRAEVRRLRQSRFVRAHRAQGFPERFILLHTILPVSILPGVSALVLLTPEIIGIEVGLAFFGLGPQPPTPTLGGMIFDGLSYLESAPWLWFAPAAFTAFLSACLFGLGSIFSTSLSKVG